MRGLQNACRKEVWGGQRGGKGGGRPCSYSPDEASELDIGGFLVGSGMCVSKALKNLYSCEQERIVTSTNAFIKSAKSLWYTCYWFLSRPSVSTQYCWGYVVHPSSTRTMPADCMRKKLKTQCENFTEMLRSFTQYMFWLKVDNYNMYSGSRRKWLHCLASAKSFVNSLSKPDL